MEMTCAAQEIRAPGGPFGPLDARPMSPDLGDRSNNARLAPGAIRSLQVKKRLLAGFFALLPASEQPGVGRHLAPGH
jgi:hypothetical protein